MNYWNKKIYLSWFHTKCTVSSKHMMHQQFFCTIWPIDFLMHGLFGQENLILLLSFEMSRFRKLMIQQLFYSKKIPFSKVSVDRFFEPRLRTSDPIIPWIIKTRFIVFLFSFYSNFSTNELGLHRNYSKFWRCHYSHELFTLISIFYLMYSLTFSKNITVFYYLFN